MTSQVTVDRFAQAIKNRPPDYALGQRGIKWFKNFEVEFVAFKKDYESKIHVSRKKLEEKKDQAETKLNVSADELPFKGYDRGFLVGYIKAIKELLEVSK